MSLDLEQLKEESARLGSEGPTGAGDFLDKFVKMPEGNGHITVRLMPPAKPGMFGRNKNDFFCKTRIHKLNGRSYHCPKVQAKGSIKWEGDCPICNYYNYLWNESDKKAADEQQQMQAKARQIKPIERYYYNVLVRTQYNDQTGEMEKNVGPKILSVGKTLHQMILNAIVGNKETDTAPLGDVTDIDTGRDFKIIKVMRKSGSESYPNYNESKFLDSSTLGNAEDREKWLNNLHDLAALRTLKPNEELKKSLKVHLGLIPDDSTNFDPNEYMPSRPAATVTRETKPVAESKVSAGTTTTTTASAAVVDTDESLADDDFLKQLKDL
jgi:hypothetical protein